MRFKNCHGPYKTAFTPSAQGPSVHSSASSMENRCFPWKRRIVHGLSPFQNAAPAFPLPSVPWRKPVCPDFGAARSAAPKRPEKRNPPAATAAGGRIECQWSVGPFRTKPHDSCNQKRSAPSGPAAGLTGSVSKTRRPADRPAPWRAHSAAPAPSGRYGAPVPGIPRPIRGSSQ